MLKNDKVGFATWYSRSHQYVFKLEKKGDSTWEIKAGGWTNKKENNNFITSTQIQSKKGRGKSFSWWFYMPKAQISSNMQKWEDVFKGQNNNAIYKNNKWKTGTFIPGNGQIPKFDQVETLDNYCNEQGSMRKEKQTEEKKLEIFCLSK